MSVDRGYVNLIAHLNASSSTLPLQTLNASVAHYLARAQPSVTPLAASVVSSPFFSASFSFPTLDGLQTAFRHAVHLKIKALNDEPSGIFSRGPATRIAEWVSQVLKGLQGGHPVLRFTGYSGLLHGLNDRETDLRMEQSFTRRRVEEELVIALAEIIDFVSPANDPWEREFKSYVPNTQDFLPSTLVLASRVLSLVASDRLKAIPLATFSRILQASVVDAFQQGTFVSNLLTSFVASEEGRIDIPTNSAFARNIEQLSNSLIILQMASLSAMFTQVISVMAEYRPSEAWSIISELMCALEGMTNTLEEGWSNSPLSDTEHEDRLTPDTQTITTSLWLILKTLLFTTIRLTDRVLSTLLFVSPPTPHFLPDSTPPLSAFDITRLSLRTLSHLSFILPRFGGVSSTASTALPELLKTFYTALDVLSSDPTESREFVREVCTEVARVRADTGVKRGLREAKEAYALACVEQVISVLDNRTVKEDVYPLCEPHLNDSTHRETYESAHSVMLAIFSAHAKAQKAGTGSPVVSEEVAFAEQIVPAYTHCLIINSGLDKLNTTQLCMAYRALVGCASAFGDSRTSASPSESETPTKTSVSEGDAYAWFCIDVLLSVIRTSTAQTEATREHRKKLLLALVSLISAASLRILPRLLSEIELLFGEVSNASSELDEEAKLEAQVDWEELIKTMFEELLSVGDEEKEFAIRWWGEWKARLRAKEEISDGKPVNKGKGKEIIARL